jgi:hypothetical protein
LLLYAFLSIKYDSPKLLMKTAIWWRGIPPLDHF